MRIGFSLILGIAVVRLARRPLWRVAGALSVFVLFVIVATGNHFFFDAAAGAAVGVIATGMTALGATSSCGPSARTARERARPMSDGLRQPRRRTSSAAPAPAKARSPWAARVRPQAASE